MALPVQHFAKAYRLPHRRDHLSDACDESVFAERSGLQRTQLLEQHLAVAEPELRPKDQTSAASDHEADAGLAVREAVAVRAAHAGREHHVEDEDLANPEDHRVAAAIHQRHRLSESPERLRPGRL